MFLQRLNAITIGRRCAALRCFIVAVALIVAIPSQGAARGKRSLLGAWPSSWRPEEVRRGSGGVEAARVELLGRE